MLVIVLGVALEDLKAAHKQLILLKKCGTGESPLLIRLDLQSPRDLGIPEPA
jgi:hypothetical protein